MEKNPNEKIPKKSPKNTKISNIKIPTTKNSNCHKFQKENVPNAKIPTKKSSAAKKCKNLECKNPESKIEFNFFKYKSFGIDRYKSHEKPQKKLSRWKNL